MQEFTMALQSRIHILLADLNAQRARAGQRPLSVRALAREIGVDNSTLHRVVNGGDHITLSLLDKLLQYFNLNSLDDLLEYREGPNV
jgi:DNA-binding Xre family transcriptional regulator